MGDRAQRSADDLRALLVCSDSLIQETLAQIVHHERNIVAERAELDRLRKERAELENRLDKAIKDTREDVPGTDAYQRLLERQGQTSILKGEPHDVE